MENILQKWETLCEEASAGLSKNPNNCAWQSANENAKDLLSQAKFRLDLANKINQNNPGNGDRIISALKDGNLLPL